MEWKTDIISVPMINMHPSQITSYNELYYDSGVQYTKKKPLIKIENNTNKLKLSSQSSRKLGRSIDYLVHLSSSKEARKYKNKENFNYKLSFITLTLSSRQLVTDQILTHELLNQFFIEARKRWNLKNYVWRAERQKNLNTHYHIICDVFIPWSELRNVWNRIQEKLGIISQYKSEMELFHKSGFKLRNEIIKFWPAKAQREAYENGKRAGWSNPNSTDIHSLRNIKDINKYVQKYMRKPKDRENERIQRKAMEPGYHGLLTESAITPGALKYLNSVANTARLWSCSYSISRLKGAKDIIDSRYKEELERLRKLPSTKVVQLEHCTVFYFNYQSLEFLNCTNLLLLFSTYINDSGYFEQCKASATPPFPATA
jgi:hypothetical protein